MLQKIFVLCCLTIPCFGTNPYHIKHEEGLIKCFDPHDPSYDKEGVPFLVMDTESQAEILEIGKTKNFSGKEIISIAKTLQKEACLPSMLLVDTALSLPCEYDGKWCCDEALMELKMAGIFIYGQTYYESLGAEPLDPNFHVSADYIHDLPLGELLFELEKFNSNHQAKKLTSLLKKITQMFLLQTFETTIGEVSNRLYLASKDSDSSHLLWHLFYDNVIGDKDSFAIDYILKAYNTHELPAPLLAQLLAIVKNEGDQLVQLGYQFGEDCTEYRLCHFQKKLESCNHLPALFLISRATNQMIRNTIETQSMICNSPHFKEVYAIACQSDFEPEFTLIPGFTLANWIIAKNKVRQTRLFQFSQ